MSPTDLLNQLTYAINDLTDERDDAQARVAQLEDEVGLLKEENARLRERVGKAEGIKEEWR